MTPAEPAPARGPLTVKARTIQLGTRASPAGFSVIDADGEEFAWTWDESRARLIAAAPELLAFVEELAGALRAMPIPSAYDNREQAGKFVEYVTKASHLLAAVRGQP